LCVDLSAAPGPDPDPHSLRENATSALCVVRSAKGAPHDTYVPTVAMAGPGTLGGGYDGSNNDPRITPRHEP
jgi:hypothetical protein